MKKETPTPEQIAEWKAKHAVYLLKAENGSRCYIKDPLTDFKVMKMAFSAIAKSSLGFVQTVINNCFLFGDEEMKTNPNIQMGLVDQISEISEIPDHTITRSGSKITITVEDYEVIVRAAQRDDVRFAEERNSAREPFMTNAHILDKIALSDISGIQKNSRIYIGVLVAIDKVKEKVLVSVEKL